MSEPNNSAWPFTEISGNEGFDIDAIFGSGNSAANQADPFAVPAPVSAAEPAPTPVAQEVPPAPVAAPAPAPAVVTATPEPKAPAPAKAAAEVPTENPIAVAFEQKTAENTKVGLLEKPPVFYHKGVNEEIEDASMTFEELRIRKSDAFTDLEEGKRVSWSVEYCGIRKEVKDPNHALNTLHLVLQRKMLMAMLPQLPCTFNPALLHQFMQPMEVKTASSPKARSGFLIISSLSQEQIQTDSTQTRGNIQQCGYPSPQPVREDHSRYRTPCYQQIRKATQKIRHCRKLRR